MFWKSAGVKSVSDLSGSGGGQTEYFPSGPRLGIALGSGAARGWAHIGVIERLMEEGIVPDVVAGASIGALVGGCHAAGKLDELKEFALSLTRRRVFGLLDITWRGSGLISGNRLTDLLDEELGDLQIEDLKQPFICIATELATGHELWLKRGRLVDAMRASYAMPGVFEPVYFNHHWLIDGAVVNPIPVSACRALDARVVLAVNLNTDAFGAGTVIQSPAVDPMILRHRRREPDAEREIRADVPGITAVLVAAFNISQDRLSRSRLAGDPPDIVISPRANGVGLFDFDEARTSIEMGREAVGNALPGIEQLMRAFELNDIEK